MTNSITQDPIPGAIAIIGMAGRFPGASNIPTFWSNLTNGIESVRIFSDDELARSGIAPEQFSDPSYVRARAVLDAPEMFDAEFFGFNHRDAQTTDPQQRIFLECSWECLEDAGYVPSSYDGSIGVFAGSSLNTYFLKNVLGDQEKIAAFAQAFQVDGYNLLIGNDKDYLATRVAHKLDLRGPALTIQTACSTSLVAINQAIGALNTFQCDMAIAGGVSISFPQERGYLYQEGAIASGDGHCRAFDEDAKGTVFGSGCGVALIKRLEDAIADRDHIYAIIRSCAINNDGADKVSYLAPSVNGQAEVIALSHALAEVDADTISYVEAHGTGTPMGDPIEVAGLTQAFRMSTEKCGYCALGTAKTNIGHLEAAAGITGIIKTALALKHRQIPASLHYNRPNPKINFQETPFYVVSELTAWENCPTPRRAGISSFGVGGTNAHAILEEAPTNSARKVSRSNQIFLLSARTDSALENATTQFVDFLPQLSCPSDFADAAFTMSQGRRAFEHRRFFIADDDQTAIDRFQEGSKRGVYTQTSRQSDPNIVFMFPGQGAQHVNMGRELYRTEKLYREIVDECSKLIEPELGLDIRTLLFPEGGYESEATDQLTRTVYTQPALFIAMYAQARLWMSWGIKPAALVGHSAGEYVAATLAGVMELGDALKVIATRARDMQRLPGGGMLSVRAPEESVSKFLSGSLSIAGINSHTLCVVSGPHDEIKNLVSLLGKKKIICKELHTSHAFHSAMMDPMVDPFREKIAKINLSTAKIPIVSSFTGDWIQAGDWADPTYWANQLRGTVRFADAVSALARDPNRIFLEVGPGQTLAALAAANPDRSKSQPCLPSMPPIGNPAEQAAMLTAVGKLWLAGIEPDWDSFFGDDERGRISLPTYPFEKKSYWVESTPQQKNVSQAIPTSPPDSVESVIFDQLQAMKEQISALSGNS